VDIWILFFTVIYGLEFSFLWLKIELSVKNTNGLVFNCITLIFFIGPLTIGTGLILLAIFLSNESTVDKWNS
jgi:hypothetical protein